MGLLLFPDFLPLLAVNGISASDEVVGAGLDHTSQSPDVNVNEYLSQGLANI